MKLTVSLALTSLAAAVTASADADADAVHSNQNSLSEHVPQRLLHSVLLEKPGLLSNHFPDGSAREFVTMSNTLTYQNGGDYQSFSDSEKRVQVKRIVSRLTPSAPAPSPAPAPDLNRQLFTTGHLADVLAGNCNATDVYEQTSYDDSYEPVCTCYQDTTTGQITMECVLGDDVCSSLLVDTVCSGTHEVFFFSDTDGDLSSKATCTLCKSDNCDGVEEICTSVAFNDDLEPEGCQVVKLGQVVTTGNTTVSTDSERCTECQICGGTGIEPFGVEHSCFDDPTNGCDSDTFAHLHNFIPGRVGDTPVGGVFAETCTASSIDRALYSYVNYDSGYSTLCDCDDPTSGSITCDIHYSQCFANLCTDISEVFFFSRQSGQYEAKWTINWDSLLWTQTTFDANTGRATGCSVLDNDPTTGELLQCTNCKICDSAQDGAGVTYGCFGTLQPNCDTSDGRAKFNFAMPVSAPAPTPPGSAPAPSENTPPTPVEDDANTLPLVLGALLGGMALAFIIVLAVRQRTRPDSLSSPNSNTADDDMTVGSSVAPPSVAGDVPEEPQFSIGDGDDENPPVEDSSNVPGVMA
jgi:hypothetical protein